MKTIFEGEHVFVHERDGWEFVERKRATEGVVVIATTDRDEVILTEQVRRAVDARVIDYPAGLVGDEGNHDPESTARNELEEETGFTCDSLERLTKGPTSPGLTSEILTLYRARGVRRVGEGGGVGGEEITVHVVPLESIESWLLQKEGEGILVDLKVRGGLYYL
jgi:ADP-ribose pyrophosphatase